MGKMSITTKLISFVLLVLVPSFAFAVTRIGQIRGQIVQDEIAINKELTGALSTSVTSYCQSIWSIQQALGSIVLQNTASSQSLQEVFQTQEINQPGLSRLFWIDNTGRITAASELGWLGRDLSHLDIFQKAINGQSKLLSSVRNNLLLPNRQVVIGHAVHYQGYLLGIVSQVISIDQFARAFPWHQLSKGISGLYDGLGQAVYLSGEFDSLHLTGPIPTGSKLSKERLVNQSLAEPVTYTTRNGKKQEWLEVIVPIKDTNWVALGALPSFEAAVVARHEIIEGIVLLACVTLASLALGVAFSKRQVSRLFALQEAAASLSEGFLDVRVVENGLDELGEVEASFNHMANRLQTALRREKILGKISNLALADLSFADISSEIIGFIFEEFQAEAVVLWYENSETTTPYKMASYGQVPDKAADYCAYIGQHGNQSGRIDLFFSSPRSLSPSDKSFLLSSGHLLNLIKTQRIQQRQLQESEARFKLLVNGLRHLGISLLDPQGVILSWNTGAEKLTGYSENEMIGKPLSNLQSVLSNQDGLLTEARVEGKCRYAGWFTHKNGKEFWANGSLTALTNQRGRVRGYINVLQDNTRHTRFLQIASHELKNPLSIIRGLSELVDYRLTRGVDGAKNKTSLQMISTQVDRLTDMLDSVLEAFRIQGGQFGLEIHPVSIDGLLQEVIPAVVEVSPKHSLTLDLCGDCWVMGDKSRLAQVFVNLVENSIKYSPAGGKITVCTNSGEDQVIASVSDQGIGIPQAALPHVFDSFYRVEGTDKPSGMGLGLFVCHSIVNRHQGEIWIESIEGEGTTVFVKLPRGSQAQSDQ